MNAFIIPFILYKGVIAVIYIILLVIMMAILSFAFKLVPNGRDTAEKLLIAAAVLMSAYILISITVRRGMLSDLTSVGIRYILPAVGAVIFCLAAAVIASFSITRKNTQNMH